MRTKMPSAATRCKSTVASNARAAQKSAQTGAMLNRTIEKICCTESPVAEIRLASEPIREIPASMATQMVEQVELGFRLVDQYGAMADPAAQTPQHAFAGQQN